MILESQEKKGRKAIVSDMKKVREYKLRLGLSSGANLEMLLFS